MNKVAVCTFEVGYNIAIEDSFAYVTDNQGVLIIDVENPSSPKKLGRIETSEVAFGVSVKNSIVYVAGSNDGLLIANASNPAQPEILGQYTDSGSAYCVGIQDHYGFLGYSDTRLDVLDLTDLTNPVFIKQLSGHRYDDIVIHNDILYGAAPNSGLVIYNISDPTNPLLLKVLSAEGATDISIHEDLLFLGCHLLGIRVINITEPSSATILSFTAEDDGGEAQGVVYTAGFLCVADNWGVELFNLSTSTSITKIDELRRGIVAAHDIAAIGNFVFVAKGAGLVVFEISTSQSSYFPPFLYYVIPVSAVLVVGLCLLIYRKKSKKK